MENHKIKSVTIGIPITNLEEGINWYRKLFPNQKELIPMEGIWEISVTSSVWLQLFESDTKEISSRSINLETNNIELSHDFIKSLNVKVGKIEEVPETVKYFEFTDPFGNNFSFVICSVL